MKKRSASFLVMMLSTIIIRCGNSEKAAEYGSTADNNVQIVELDKDSITAINVDETEPIIESTNEETESKEAADTEDKQTPEIEVTDDLSGNVITNEQTESKETADTKDKQISEIEIADDSSENVTKEEGIYAYNEESQMSEIALSFSLKNVSSTGATLVFDQYDADAPKGELMFGEDFVIEVLKNGVWEETPIPVDGNYAFHAVAYNLPCEKITEREIVWKVPYGELEPGEYRIGKSVDDFIESGNFDRYMVYAHFILNSN